MVGMAARQSPAAIVVATRGGRPIHGADGARGRQQHAAELEPAVERAELQWLDAKDGSEEGGEHRLRRLEHGRVERVDVLQREDDELLSNVDAEDAQ